MLSYLDRLIMLCKVIDYSCNQRGTKNKLPTNCERSTSPTADGRWALGLLGSNGQWPLGSRYYPRVQRLHLVSNGRTPDYMYI